MFEQFTPEARTVVVDAQEHARKLGHHWIGCEHLLLALASTDGATGQALRHADITPERVRAEILDMIGPGPAGAASVLDTLDQDALAAIGIDLDTVRGKIEAAFGPAALRPRQPTPRLARWRRRAKCRTQDPSGHLPFTPQAKKCLEQSLHEALALHSGYLGIEHVALALIATNSSAAAHILSSIGVSTQRLRTDILDRYRQAS
jgi:ATP-dependent Clp protease ATP-binding subunit ClpA